MFFFPFDIFLIIGILFFLVGGTKILIDSIGIILLTIFILILTFWGLRKKPIIVVCVYGAVLLYVILFFIWGEVSESFAFMKERVTLYESIEEINFVDTNGYEQIIPQNAIVAIYNDHCYWFYGNKEYYSEIDSSEVRGMKIKEIKSVKYKDFFTASGKKWVLALKDNFY